MRRRRPRWRSLRTAASSPFSARESLPPVAELAEPELRLAGVRINPRTNGPSREAFYNRLSFRPVGGGEEIEVELPEEARLSFPRWSPDGSRLAFVITTPAGLVLWLAEVSTGEARAFSDAVLNATLGAPFAWLPDGSGLLVKRVFPVEGATPEAPSVPSGPVVRESGGKAAPARTYQDLLENPHQERLFEHYFGGQLARVSLAGGEPVPLGPDGIFSDFSPSPDGGSSSSSGSIGPSATSCPGTASPRGWRCWDLRGETVHHLADLPLAEDVPVAFDAVPDGPRAASSGAPTRPPRSCGWRRSTAATRAATPRSATGSSSRRRPSRPSPRTLLTLEHRYAGDAVGPRRLRARLLALVEYPPRAALRRAARPPPAPRRACSPTAPTRTATATRACR